MASAGGGAAKVVAVFTGPNGPCLARVEALIYLEEERADYYAGVIAFG